MTKRKYEKEYTEYYTKLLEQMKKGGLNKIQVKMAEAKYKNSQTVYDEFVNLYELSKEDTNDKEIVFTFEG